MRRLSLFSLSLLAVFLPACVSVSATQTAPLFFYLRLAESPRLVLQSTPDSPQAQAEIRLPAPADCDFWSLTPAPAGPYLALEWQCPAGPLVQLVDSRARTVESLLDPPAPDSHFLAWSPDGRFIYLRTSTMADPRVLRLEVATRQGALLPISPNTYNLAVSPDNGMILYALTYGLGSGSELRLADPDGNNSQKVLSDVRDIIGLMRFSPDGKQIAAIRLPDSQVALPPGELWVADSDGKHARPLAGADAGRGMFPVWSPDGTQIAFLGRTHPDDPNSLNLSILTLATSQVLALSMQPEAPPAWSPDGRQLVFTLAGDGKMNVWSYDEMTGTAQKLFDDACCAGWIH